jgi:RraA family protein
VRRRSRLGGTWYSLQKHPPMNPLILKPSVPPPTQSEIRAALQGIPVAVISDNLDRLPGPTGLRAFHRSGAMLGTAVTVRTRAGDNLAVHQALELIQPGDVLVVDGGGDTSRAIVGEILKAIAESKGCAGFVIYGAIRDSGAFAASDFPCFARAVIHRGPNKFGPGEINVPISIGGSVIQPGDIVAGDEDGVVSFAPDRLAELSKAVRAQLERESEILQSIRDGTYRGAYGAGLTSTR